MEFAVFEFRFFLFVGSILYLNYLIRITAWMWYTESLLWSVHKTSRLHLFGWERSYAICVSGKRVKQQVRVSNCRVWAKCDDSGNFRRSLRRTTCESQRFRERGTRFRNSYTRFRNEKQLRAQHVTRIFQMRWNIWMVLRKIWPQPVLLIE